MTWFWYVEKDDEITVDLDRVTGRRIDEIRRQLEMLGADGDELNAESVWLYPSGSDWHQHLIVKMSRPMPGIDRVAWSLVLGNDPRRAARSLLRIGTAVPIALLVSPAEWEGFYRRPDEWCPCNGTEHKMNYCPVGKMYRPADELGRAGTIGERWKHYGRVV